MGKRGVRGSMKPPEELERVQIVDGVTMALERTSPSERKRGTS